MGYQGCERKLLYSCQGSTLYHYHTKNLPPSEPLLIFFALVNTPKILDLHPSCSFIAHLLQQHNNVFLLEWKRPDPQDNTRSMSDYIFHDMDLAINVVIKKTSSPRVHVMGICQAGYFSLCYAAQFSEKLASLILLVTPVNFDVPRNRLFQMTRYIDMQQLVDVFGNIPGWVMSNFMKQIEPFRIPYKKWQALKPDPSDNHQEVYRLMEQWADDCPDQAGTAFLEFTQRCVQENALVKGNLHLNGRAIHLSAIKVPILNIYASYDHLWPTKTVTALQDHYTGERYQEYIFKGGHIGIFVSQKALKEIPQVIMDWIE